MKRIEDIMNWLTDMDWGWWPVVSLRPPKERDIDNRVLLKISPIFGGALGFIVLPLYAFFGLVPIKASTLVIFYLSGCTSFFVVYKFTFAWCWNRRARRLRGQSPQREEA